MATIVTVLISVVGPSPGVANREVLTMAVALPDLPPLTIGGAGATSEEAGGVMQ
jgi:hypothetical protein